MSLKWETRLSQNIHTLEDLKKHLPINPKEHELLQTVIETHPMSISQYYLSLINPNDPKDPIRRMIVPSIQELNPAGRYDTSGEKLNTKTVGLQHKYAQTALILATNRCGAYCRFCFRKRLVGLPTSETLKRFNKTIQYIKKHPEINNVLISGGDPFTLRTEVLEKFLQKLSPIKHLKFIRFGTRTPVTFPYRILDDPSLPALLKKYSQKNRRLYIVTHFNHPNEITPQATEAIDKLIQANVIVNNQTVLLNGINDNADTLAELLNNLVSIGVNPYYVFQCRPVKRVKSHFPVPLARGYQIIENAKKQLNGHSKRFKYVMSHRSGKIEIVGIIGREIYFKFHQAKYKKDLGRLFKRKLNPEGTWLDDFKEI